MSNEYSDIDITVNQKKATALAEVLCQAALTYAYAHDLNKLEVVAGYAIASAAFIATCAQSAKDNDV